jgi:hypothetical protein
MPNTRGNSQPFLSMREICEYAIDAGMTVDEQTTNVF